MNNWSEWAKILGGFSNQKMEEIGLIPFLSIMGISLICSLFISFLYVKFYKSRSTGSKVYRAFPILGISITGIFICIQFSLPLSLGLLGALSIVRFRTPIKEPEEIGFIMLVVAVSISCATFNMLFLSVLLLISIIALLIMQFGQGVFKGSFNDGMLIITLPSNESMAVSSSLLELMKKDLPMGRVDSITENGMESIISYSFVTLEQSRLPELQKNIKDITEKASVNVFYNRSGEI